jgi:hypothetical protein
MGEGLGSPLLSLDGQCGRNWLSDTRMKRRRSAWDDKIGVALVASPWTTIAVAGPWTDERRMIIK